MSRKFGVNKCIDSLCSLYLLLIVSLCICSCTSEYNILDNDNSKLLNFSVSVPEWKNNDSSFYGKTRAMPISGTSLGTSSSFNLIADVYDGTKNYSTIIKDEAVSFTNNMWQTTSTHYWPGTANNTVSFYAYYPSSISSSITHTAGSAPTLSYTVPDDAINQIDIITATKTNVSGNTNSSTPLIFNHILAAIKFTVGSSGMINGTITKISLNGILNTGNYSFTNGWTPLSSSITTYTKNVSVSSNAGTEIVSENDPFLIMPQTLSNASLTVTYSGGTKLIKNIDGILEAGKFYTYNLSSSFSSIQDFNYTGVPQSYKIPLTGTYKLEVWGAEGGYGWDMTAGGKGGYSFGYARLYKDQIVYIVVGGSGNPGSGRAEGGYNGGGQSNSQIGPDGGGATHISTTNRGLLSNYSNNQSDILIVAGGGGGSERNMGGSGGGLFGISGSIGWVCSWDSGQLLTVAECGTQTSGGIAGTTTDKGNAEPGCFGKGGNGYVSVSQDAGGAGGGGWYGGGGIAWYGGGGGGSGYIGGVINGQTIAGDSSIPSTSGGTENGHPGDGYARITFVSAN